jgi:guanylate kinase
LEQRGTDSPDVIEIRRANAEYEMSFAPRFDVVLVNDDLPKAQAEALGIVKSFLET